MKKLRVTVDGKSYDVVVEFLDGPPQVAPAAGVTAAVSTPVTAATVTAPTAPVASRPAGAAGGLGAVASPLSGKIVSIDVKVGQSVEEGAQVITIEAMKMNTYIFAPKSGRVTAVLVNAGDGVEEGAVLLEIN
jgi:glutaconyl-CoA/methylmalonyl-CoA decarboxylase subunit gamma